jgi:hypothetical protein
MSESKSTTDTDKPRRGKAEPSPDPATEVAKYQHTETKQKRDAVRARFAPLRTTIAHAANGDRAALASALSQLADLHQGPLDDDTAADHLREAGAALTMDRVTDAQAALQAARGLLSPGLAADKVSAALDALAGSEGTADDDLDAALKLIDEALAEAGREPGLL